MFSSCYLRSHNELDTFSILKDFYLRLLTLVGIISFKLTEFINVQKIPVTGPIFPKDCDCTKPCTWKGFIQSARQIHGINRQNAKKKIIDKISSFFLQLT